MIPVAGILRSPVILLPRNGIRITTSELIQPAPPMNSPKRVVVCGGGAIGVCTAYFLAKKGAAVTLIEKSEVACAASGKAGGFLALDWCDGGPVEQQARASFNLHRSLSDELDGPQSYGYRPLTTLSLTVTESQAPAAAASGSVPLPSWVDGPVCGSRTIGTVETTAQVHPRLFTRTLIERAVERHGVEVVIGKLESVVVDGGRVGSVVLEGGRVVETDAVVLALGPWSSKLGLLSSLFRVYGLKADSIVFEPREPNAITPHALSLSYYPSKRGSPLEIEVYPRPSPTEEVYVCVVSAEEEVPDDPDEIRSKPEWIGMLKRVAKTVSSHLGEEGVKAEQACFLPCTDDGVPVIGELPGVRGCYVATGHSCWGILNAPATGAAMAELIIDGHSSIVDLRRFSPARFVVSTKV
ncbi:putative oxidoreductase TDA3 [Lotus japonicus]|uniref:putative oxidoreductase TDA3 n=1 Tax=Lotus japonicus TaxID=34305 RepID=UPI00258910FF|nr:putative oxidoreductase TDA3 [Lotus japonicus]